MAQSSRQSETLTLTDRELLDRLSWFTQLRWLFGAFCLALLLVSHYVLEVRFFTGEPSAVFDSGLPGTGRQVPVWLPVEVVAGLFAYNAVFTWLVRWVRRGRITRSRILWLGLGQIVCDLVAVCALVHNTGGVENFFVVLMALPLVIAAELLPTRLAYGVAAVAVGLVHALAWSEQQGWIPHVHVIWPGSAGVAKARLFADPLYVLEATGGMTVLLFGTVFIASTIAGRLRRSEEELERAYRQVQAADEAKSFFMRKAGHELRAPLVAVGSILGAISRTVDGLGDEHRRLIDRAQQRTQAVMAIINDLRRYANLQSTARLLAPQTVRFNEIVRAVAELLRQQAESAGLQLTCRAEHASVAGDEELLRELVSNLVVNAIQYTPAGGRIDVTVQRAGSTAVLTVADTGIGISEQAGEQLFEEFFRAEEAKRVFAEGTGLGLAICRRIARMHGGGISAASRPEGGSIFTVELPAGP